MLFEDMISNLLLLIFGNPLLIGLFLMLMFYIIGLALHLTPEIQIVMMFLMTYIILSQYLQWLSTVLLGVVGIFLGLYLFYRILGR